METVSLIVQQLHVGVISLLAFAPIWLNLVTYSNRTFSCLIVLLELLAVLLEYIDHFHCDHQGSLVVWLKYSSYYASIMLNAFRHLLCS